MLKDYYIITYKVIFLVKNCFIQNLQWKLKSGGHSDDTVGILTQFMLNKMIKLIQKL